MLGSFILTPALTVTPPTEVNSFVLQIRAEMAGEPELTGLAKHFNSTTFTGRANVAKATYGGKLKTDSLTCYVSVTNNDIFSAILLTIVAVKAKNALKEK